MSSWYYSLGMNNGNRINMKLPVGFLERMRSLLSEKDHDLFIKSYDLSRTYGLRANTLKIHPEKLKLLIPELLESIPWTNDGFYYPSEEIVKAARVKDYDCLYRESIENREKFWAVEAEKLSWYKGLETEDYTPKGEMSIKAD